MEHLHEPEVDPLDIDRPGYYSPTKEEFFHGLVFDQLVEEGWQTMVFDIDSMVEYLFLPTLVRIKYLQAKDIQDLGFARVAPNIPMYQRGSYTITAYRLLDPSYSRLKISQNGVTVFEGHVKNKSELRRILILNEINFAGD